MKSNVIVILLGLVGGSYISGVLSQNEVEMVKTIANANNLFTQDVYHEILKSKGSESFVVSPYSLASVLTMIRAGATGSTEEELTKGLRLENLNDSLIYDGYSDLIFHMHENMNVVIETGNRIFTADGFDIKKSYLKVLREKLYSQTEEIDFTRNIQAADRINRYVATATRNKIKNIVSPDALDEDTKMILINAIYFKGVWKYEFSRDETVPAPFTILDGTTVPVEMMSMHGEFNYKKIARLNSAVLSLPYKGDRFSFVIILPNENMKLSDVESLLTDAVLAEIPSKLKRTDVRIKFPKFKLESEINFVSTKVLENLGMKQFLEKEYKQKISPPAMKHEEKRSVQVLNPHVEKRSLKLTKHADEKRSIKAVKHYKEKRSSQNKVSDDMNAIIEKRVESGDHSDKKN